MRVKQAFLTAKVGDGMVVMRWYYRLFDQEFGPSGLDELSEMVRQGTLTATDLVRPADSQEWQPAECDAVLGLQFLQDAGLQDAEQTAAKSGHLSQVQQMSAFDALPDASPPNVVLLASPFAAPVVDQGADTETSAVALAELAGSPSDASETVDSAAVDSAPEAAVDPNSEPQAATEAESVEHHPAPSLEWQAAVKAALLQRWKLAPKSEEEIAASTEGRLSTWLNAVWRYPLWGVMACVIWGVQALIWLVSVTIGQLAIVRRLGLFLAQAIDVTLILIEEGKSYVRKAIVVFLTVSVMGICGYSLWSWTAREQLRFPSRRQEAVTYLFPFVGPCEPAEYWFWLINTMTVAGLVTCGFAIWLIKHAK